MKWLKGFSGYFIYYALLLTLNTFAGFKLGSLTFFSIATITYLLALLVFLFPKRSAIAFGLVVALGVGILLVDYGVQRYQLSHSGTMTLTEEASFWVASISENPGSFGLARWIKEDLAVHWGKDFTLWFIYERVQNQILWEQAASAPPPQGFEEMSLVLGAVGVFIITQLLLSKWFGLVGQFVPLVMFIVLWYGYYEISSGIHGLYAYGLMVYGVIRHFDKLQKKYKNEDQDYYNWKRMLPFSLIMSAVIVTSASIVFFMVPVEKISISLDTYIPNLWGMRTDYDNSEFKLYSLGNTAYLDDSGVLGGSVKELDSETPLFWVTLDKPLLRPLYLKAQVKSYYNGYSWSNQDATYRNDYADYLGVKENANLVRDIGGGVGLEDPKISNYYVKGMVEFDKLKTISVLAPLGFYNSTLDPKKVYASNQNQAFYKGGMFVAFLERYGFEATQKDFTRPGPEHYQISETVGLPFRRIAKAIGGLGQTPQEKVAVLVSYLSTVCKYNLEVEKKGISKDFVTNFVLETQEGYCTYFASALVVMARINGIPARYVEGFRVDSDQVDPKTIKAKVTEADAHAWVEVYFEGEGWRVIEATPPYVADMIDDQELAKNAQKALEIAAGKASTLDDEDENPANTDNAALDADSLAANLAQYLEDAQYDEQAAYDWQNDPLGRLEQRTVEDLEAEEAAKLKAAVEAQRIEKERAQQRTLWLVRIVAIILTLLLIGFIAIWWYPVATRFVGIHHSKLVVNLYNFSHLLNLSRGLKSANIEAVYLAGGVSADQVKEWMKLVYDRPDRIDGAMVIKANDALRAAFQREYAHIRTHLGFWRYWQLRCLNRI